MTPMIGTAGWSTLMGRAARKAQQALEGVPRLQGQHILTHAPPPASHPAVAKEHRRKPLPQPQTIRPSTALTGIEPLTVQRLLRLSLESQDGSTEGVLTATLDEEDRDAFGAHDGVVVSSSGRAMVGTMTVWCAP